MSPSDVDAFFAGAGLGAGVFAIALLALVGLHIARRLMDAGD